MGQGKLPEVLFGNGKKILFQKIEVEKKELLS
jgi:hypothetical protein